MSIVLFGSFIVRQCIPLVSIDFDSYINAPKVYADSIPTCFCFAIYITYNLFSCDCIYRYSVLYSMYCYISVLPPIPQKKCHTKIPNLYMNIFLYIHIPTYILHIPYIHSNSITQMIVFKLHLFGLEHNRKTFLLKSI